MSEVRDCTQSPQRSRHESGKKSEAQQQSRNRKVVLVGETFLNTKNQSVKRASTGSLPQLSVESGAANSYSNAARPSRKRASLLAPPFESSPRPAVTSPRSSVSSILDISSSMSNLVMPPSSEEQILEELRKQISQSSSHNYQLKSEIKQIPLLQSQLEELQKERRGLASTLQEQEEVVKSLKQRISMLQEQNSQLGKLVQSQKEGSGEVIAMRNAIMASLAQLKQLQEQVNIIPFLKKQISTLEQERDKLCSECTSLDVSLHQTTDYSSLLEENALLKSTNHQLVEEIKVVGEQLTIVSRSCDGLKMRMEAFENVQSNKIPLTEHMKRLETEKDTLYHEIVDLRFHHRVSQNMDFAELSEQVATLQKENSELQTKLERMQLDTREQKEQLVLKLFEIESLNVKTQKYELEKKVLEMEQLQAHSEFNPILRSATASPEIGENPCYNLDEAVLSPESKIQMLKLEQLRIHSTQSRELMQTILTERNELERKVAELSAQVEERGINDLQQKLHHTETKLSLALTKNGQLEKELKVVMNSGNKMPSGAMEIERLQMQLQELQVECSYLAESKRKLEKKCLQQKETSQSLDGVKDEKRKLEKKYKESKERLRSLAQELAGSVRLLKDYQAQSSSLEEQLMQVKSEMKTLQVKYAEVLTDLEVARVENRTEGTATASTVLLDVANTTTGTVNSSTMLQAQPEVAENAEDLLRQEKEKSIALSNEVEQLQMFVSKLSQSLSEIKSANLKLGKKLGSEEDVTLLASENSRLVIEIKQKEEKLAVKQENMLSLANKVQILEQNMLEAKQLRAELIEVQEQVKILHSDKKLMNEQLQERDRQNAQMAKIDTQARKELTGKVEVLSNEAGTLKRDFDATSATLQKERTEKANLLRKIEEQETAIHLLEDQLNELQVKNSNLMIQNGKMQVECRTLKEHLHELNTRQSNCQQNSEIVALLTQEKQMLQQRYDDLVQHMHAYTTDKELLEQTLCLTKRELQRAHDQEHVQKKEFENLCTINQRLSNEVEGYKAMIVNLTRQIDQAETREMEHEALLQKIRGLERTLSDSSQLKLDNMTLFSMLQEAVCEVSSGSGTLNTQNLQEENLRLEQQVSVLTQWNDKQRQEIEMLESQIEQLNVEKDGMIGELVAKEGSEGEVVQLRQELKETELEVNALRRQVKADLQEEMQVKIETQTQLLSVFSEHNQLLQVQIEELQQQVRSLGGSLKREKAVSPPPFPDMTTEGVKSRTISEMTRENDILKQRIATLELEVRKMRTVSASVRRRASTLTAIASIPVAPIHDDVQVR